MGLYLLRIRNPSTEASQLPAISQQTIASGHQLTFSSESSRQFKQRESNQSKTDLFLSISPDSYHKLWTFANRNPGWALLFSVSIPEQAPISLKLARTGLPCKLAFGGRHDGCKSVFASTLYSTNWMQSITVSSVLSPKPHTLPTIATCTLSLVGPRFILVAKPTGYRLSTSLCWVKPRLISAHWSP